MSVLRWGRSWFASCSGSGCNISRVYGSLFFSTQIPVSSASDGSIYSRISPLGNPQISVSPVLNQWVEEGRLVEQKELQRIIRMLRQYGRFRQALEVSEWMTNRRYLDLSAGDAAVRLDLISKVLGVEEAEKYFNNLPDHLRGFEVYGALLNCYAHGKFVEKAAATMQKIRELGFARTALPYNVMLNLYSHLGENEKLESMVEEMESRGICCDRYTHCIRLGAYAATADVEGMQQLLMHIEIDPEATIEWNTYVVAANGFLKAGLKEKAFAALKKSEQLVRGKARKVAYGIFLTSYAAVGKKNEVYRIWNLCQSLGTFRNSFYFSMVSSLIKLGDIDGAVKIFEEWESKQTLYDFRIPYLLISAYCKDGQLEKAEALINRVLLSGEPTPGTWECMAAGYFENNQMDKAVDSMKRAILASRSARRPNRATFATCLKYLKCKGDIESAEGLVNLCHERGHLSANIQQKLLNYLSNEEQGSGSFDQTIEEDQIFSCRDR